MKTATDFMREAEAHAMGICGFCGHNDYNRIRDDKFLELVVKDYAESLVVGQMQNPVFSDAMDSYYERKWAYRFD